MATPEQRDIARDFGLTNVMQIDNAADRADIPFYVACALMEKESHGRNVYGNDDGGMAEGFKRGVSEENFALFWWMVKEKGFQSNGVGPAQITSRGLLQSMIDEGLRPWDIEENMFFGFRLLNKYKKAADGSWREAGTRYNGSPEYGDDLAERIKTWKERLS